MKRLSIMGKFTILFIPLLMVGGVVSTVALNAKSNLQATLSEIRSATSVQMMALQSEKYVAEMGSALKGFLLNPNDNTEFERKLAADESNAKVLNEIRKNLTDPDALKLIDVIQDLDEKRLNPAENQIMDLVRGGKITEAREAFVATYLPIRRSYDDGVTAFVTRNLELTKAKMDAAAVEINEPIIRLIWTLALGLTLFGVAMLATAKGLAGSLAKINQISQELAKQAIALSDFSEQISTASSRLSASSTEQASALQETASSVDEINAMVSKNADNALRSREVAMGGQRSAMRGKDSVAEMVSAIGDINDSNAQIMDQIDQNNRQIAEIVKVISEIGNKTKVINDIVFQTKLLSFNASVEAARAGEHGKGFAVVAEEVGNLAQMSGNAAKEISQMLEGSMRKVEAIAVDTKSRIEKLLMLTREKLTSGSATAQRCGAVLDEIVNNVSDLSTMVSEIATASQEQASGVHEVNKAIGQLNIVTTQNADTSQDAAGLSSQLAKQAIEMRTVVNALVKTVQGTDDAGPSIDPVVLSFDHQNRTSGKVIPLRDSSQRTAVERSKPIAAPVKMAAGDSFIPRDDDPRFQDV